MAVDENTGAKQASTLEPLGAPVPERVYRLSEEQARAAGGRADDVWVEFRWWKFEVHLSGRVADNTADFMELITRVIAEALPPVLGEIVGVFAEMRAAWIKRVSNGNGCKLVSPWIFPAMLIPVAKRNPDTNLYWST